jgi:hypothetical protein
VQAKAEPGNVGVAQLAPTVQATESNYTCGQELEGRPSEHVGALAARIRLVPHDAHVDEHLVEHVQLPLEAQAHP